MSVRQSVSRRSFVVGALGSAALLAVRAAPSVMAEEVYSVASDGLRLRSGPGTGYSVLASLARRTILIPISSAGTANGYTWLKAKVESTGVVGYVAQEFLNHVSRDGGGYPVGTIVTVDTAGGGSANLRSAPGTSAGVIKAVANGTQGNISGGPQSANGYTWYKVDIAGTTGWMATVVLSFGSTGNGTRVKVASGPLNVRATPGLSGERLGTVATGLLGWVTTEMPREADGYVWINVQFDYSVTGWVAKNYLEWV